jgi:drug/metabolite transporter (DMT)-like permease
MVLLLVALRSAWPGFGPLLEPSLGWSRSVILVVIIGGACDIAAFAAYAIGLGVAPVWLIGLSSSFGPVLAVGYAIWRLGERPRRSQWIGLAGIMVGVVVLALAV